MIIARQKRKENIAEYILYMWHIEDTIRACNFDINTIEKNVISHFDIDVSTKKEMKEWYESLIEMMKNEEITTIGHLQINHASTRLICDLHNEIIEQQEDTVYINLYKEGSVFIEEFRAINNANDEHSVALCLQFMYGIWLLKIKNQTISEETKQAVDAISKMLAYLSKKNKDNEEF